MNNDRLKFRVWENSTKQYLNDEKFLLPSGELGFFIKSMGYPHHRIFNNQDVFIIEQCTGVKDKNGILIFEGDVVRVEDDYGVCNRKERIDTGIGTVEWVDGMWYIAGDVSNGLYEIDCTRYIEVIGNIHEMEVTKCNLK